MDLDPVIIQDIGVEKVKRLEPIPFLFLLVQDILK